MTRTRRCRLAAALAALAVLVPAVGASADSVDADVQFSVTGTSTDLSIALASGAVPGVTLTTSGSSATGNLPTTVVSDGRALLSGAKTWNVQVSTAGHFQRRAGDGLDAGAYRVARNAAHVFVPATGTVTNLLGGSLSLATYETSVGTNRLGPAGETAADATPAHSYTLISGTSALNLLGSARYSYTPQMSVEIPAGQAAGTYEGVITQTLSSGLPS